MSGDVAVQVEEFFEDDVYELLVGINGYLKQGAYDMSREDRIIFMQKLTNVNDHFRRSWWETDERLDSMGDPVTAVFLYQLLATTREWYARQLGRLTSGDHCGLCLYITYSLYGQCATYPAKPFLTKTMDGERLVELYMEVYRETDLSKIHWEFPRTHEDSRKELLNTNKK
jgi:hypothetical protein